VEYLGIGSGAHSFNTTSRQWCQQPLPEYIACREYQSEILSDTDRFNEYLMTSLRCVEGVDTEYINSQFGAERLSALLHRAKAWIASGDLLHSGKFLHIPTSRFLLSDAVISTLFEE
jgi:oxygen-independent coproporphyrinogen-3 oxidase